MKPKPNSKVTENFKLKVKRSRSGLGLYTEEPIKKGSFIIEYYGPILTNKERDERGGKYLFETSANRTIDGTGRYNIARYVNHCCKPNCEVEIIRGRVYIVAKKNITAGEELAYDYGKEYFNEYIKPYGCTCDSCSKKKK